MGMRKMIALTLSVLMLCMALGCAKQPVGSEPTAPSTAQTSAPTLESTAVPTESTAAPAETTLPTDPTQPQGPTLLDFLRIAVQPVGSTMYVWGGGWNEADTGAGQDAVTLGVSPRWAEFAALQDASYDWNTTRGQIRDGLDCSGYVGWAVYNLLETENGGEGYVCASTQMAQSLADRGLGELIPAEELTAWMPGDVMSMKGHCWIAVGMCGDGSVLLLHSSPPGVRFCGTRLADGSDSQAVALAERIMQEYYPDWYARYPDCGCAATYLTRSSAMRWSADVLRDDELLRQMTAEEVVGAIFGQ